MAQLIYIGGMVVNLDHIVTIERNESQIELYGPADLVSPILTLEDEDAAALLSWLAGNSEIPNLNVAYQLAQQDKAASRARREALEAMRQTSSSKGGGDDLPF